MCSTTLVTSSCARGCNTVLPGILVLPGLSRIFILPHERLVQPKLAIALAFGAQHFLELVPECSQSLSQCP